jgi:hypothetical protein
MIDIHIEVAIVGLVGVALGGILSNGTQIWLENRKEKRGRQRAMRLIEGELLQAKGLLRFMSEESSTWPSFIEPNTAFPTSAWQENRAYLANNIAHGFWQSLWFTYMSLEMIRQKLPQWSI